MEGASLTPSIEARLAKLEQTSQEQEEVIHMLCQLVRGSTQTTQAVGVVDEYIAYCQWAQKEKANV